MHHVRSVTSTVFIAAFFWAAAANPDDSIFSTPKVLEANVAFWKKIYAGYSVTEGVVHDAGYPNVIFKTLTGDPSGAVLRKEKATVEQSLRTVASQPESTWTDAERGIVALYDSLADSSAIEGAADRVRFQRGQKERFIDGIRRSGLYLDTIRSIFRAHGIPERVAYLPYVESGYNTAAYSRVGAAGLWQFMRSTGRMFGMTVGYAVDERRDPVRATVAAAQYLSRAYAGLNSWPLAITSYNHGLDGMKRAVAQTGSADINVIIANYSSRSFQFASRNFYACFLAVSDLAENRAAIFPDVQPLAPYRVTDVRLEYYAAPSAICQALKITPMQLSALNPAIRPVMFARDRQLPKDLLLHLPAEISAETAKAALAAVPESLKSSEPQKVQLASAAAPVPVAGADSPKATAPAPVAPVERTGTSPVAAQSSALVSGFDASLYQLDAAPASDWKSAEIRVSVDETMSHYCDWLKVSAAEIRLLNRSGRGTIRIGSRLRIPLRQQSSLDKFTTVRLEYHMALEEDFYTQYRVAEVRPYLVARGDNVWSLCNEGDSPVPVWLLWKYNKQSDLSALMPGDTIWMPVIEEKPKNEIADPVMSFKPDRSEPFNESLIRLPRESRITK